MVELHPIIITKIQVSSRARCTRVEERIYLGCLGHRQVHVEVRKDSVFLPLHYFFPSYFGFNSLTEGGHYTGFFSSLKNEL